MDGVANHAETQNINISHSEIYRKAKIKFYTVYGSVTGIVAGIILILKMI